MATKIRLQRHGRKGKPFYYIVVADSRARRDGNFIQKLGTYNPVKNPTLVELDIDASVDWLEKGAQPTDTARSILAREGVLFKKHLRGGVKKGAFTEEELNNKFDAWVETKKASIQEKSSLEVKKKEERRQKQIDEAKAAVEAKIAAEKAALEEAEKQAAEEAERKAAEEASNIANAEAPAAEVEEPSTEESAVTEGE
jgi:small subunit ribosomal protein S16